MCTYLLSNWVEPRAYRGQSDHSFTSLLHGDINPGGCSHCISVGRTLFNKAEKIVCYVGFPQRPLEQVEVRVSVAMLSISIEHYSVTHTYAVKVHHHDT